MYLLVVGMNDRSASLAEREALALDSEAARRVLADVLASQFDSRSARALDLQPHRVLSLATDSDDAVNALRTGIERIKGVDLLVPGTSVYRSKAPPRFDTPFVWPRASTRWSSVKPRFSVS